MRRFLPTLTVLLFVLSARTASAGVIVVNVALSGAQEVGPIDPAGTGSCTVTINDDADTVDVECTYSDMTSPVTAAHIHGPAPVGKNAGVIVGLTPSGGTSGTVSDTGVVLAPEEMDHVLNGLTYINIHTSMHSGGEIRGQIIPIAAAVPAASTVAGAVLVLALAAAGAVLLFRRRAAASV